MLQLLGSEIQLPPEYPSCSSLPSCTPQVFWEPLSNHSRFQHFHTFPMLQPRSGICQPQVGMYGSAQIKFLMKLATTLDGFASQSEYQVCISPSQSLRSAERTLTQPDGPGLLCLPWEMLPQHVSASVSRLVLLRQAQAGSDGYSAGL